MPPPPDQTQPIPALPSGLPNPLELTSADFARAGAGMFRVERLGGVPGALETYRRFYRLGPASTPGLEGLAPTIVRVLREESPEGEVIKFLTRVGDSSGLGKADETAHAPTTIGADVTPLPVLGQTPADLTVESVLIPMRNSAGGHTYTLCVSSQVGCAMGCTFCETAQMGLIRSLSAGEIVSQWLGAAHQIGVRPRNIVFMGMGEPLDNYDNLVRAIDILRDHNGPHVAISQITVSTVGRVDGIRKLAQQVTSPGWHRLGIAFSLNSALDDERKAIMPITRKYPLAMVQEALLAWPRYAGNKVCLEYVLIPGNNDTRRHAEAIAEFVRPFGLHKTASGSPTNQKLFAVLNLIPYNPRRNSPWPAPTEEAVAQFMGWLEDMGVFVKRRRTKGRQMMGACGQLGSEHIRRRRVVRTPAEHP